MCCPGGRKRQEKRCRNRIAKFIDANGDGVLDAGDTSITQYTWDARDRLTEVRSYATYADVVANTPTQVVDYLYDVENRWIGENIFTSSGEHETRFAYDGNQIVLEFDKDVVDNNATVGVADLSHRYVWQPGAVDQLMADEQVTTPTTAGKVVWTLGDNQGTIRDLAVTESGVTSVATHRVFDSYGNLVSSTNPSTGEAAVVACLFGYTGKAFDNATGLQNNLNRWYDAKVGRWLSEDPSGFDAGQTNLDVYCGNSPTNATDPSGLASYLGGTTVSIAVRWKDPAGTEHYQTAEGGSDQLRAVLGTIATANGTIISLVIQGTRQFRGNNRRARL